jgi:D-alanyl-D-alanine carboxypeptidase
MEEYLDMIEKEHPYSGEHLEFTDDNGQAYEVYFVKSDDGSETTNVPVPADKKYEISGNNSTGFIVTVYKDKAEIPLERTTEAAPVTSESKSEAETEAQENAGSQE